MGLLCFQAGKLKQAREWCGDEYSRLAVVVKSTSGSGRGMGPTSNISTVFTSISPVFYFVGRLTWCKTKGTHEFNLQQDPHAGGARRKSSFPGRCCKSGFSSSWRALHPERGGSARCGAGGCELRTAPLPPARSPPPPRGPGRGSPWEFRVRPGRGEKGKWEKEEKQQQQQQNQEETPKQNGE